VRQSAGGEGGLVTTALEARHRRGLIFTGGPQLDRVRVTCAQETVKKK